MWTYKEVNKKLNRLGFELVSQKGSHAKFRKSENNKVTTVIVPQAKKQIPRGTMKSIIRQAKLTTEEFEKA